MQKFSEATVWKLYAMCCRTRCSISFSWCQHMSKSLCPLSVCFRHWLNICYIASKILGRPWNWPRKPPKQQSALLSFQLLRTPFVSFWLQLHFNFCDRTVWLGCSVTTLDVRIYALVASRCRFMLLNKSHLNAAVKLFHFSKVFFVFVLKNMSFIETKRQPMKYMGYCSTVLGRQ